MFRQFSVLLFAFITLNIFYILSIYISHPATLGASITAPTVTVTATIPACPFVIITPEHRIPPTGNNALQIIIDIRPENSTTSIYTATIDTDNNGQGSLCPLPSTLVSNQYYDVLIKGLSHLRRIFPHQYFNGNSFTLDLRSPVLLAGDAHPSSDNFVNVMDYVYEVANIYGNNLRADLNRDGKVNSLEFPTLISHLYKYGDN